MEGKPHIQKCRFEVFLHYQDGLEQQQCFRFEVVLLKMALHRRVKMWKRPIFEKCQSSSMPSYLIPISLVDLILKFLSLLMVFKNDNRSISCNTVTLLPSNWVKLSFPALNPDALFFFHGGEKRGGGGRKKERKKKHISSTLRTRSGGQLFRSMLGLYLH